MANTSFYNRPLHSSLTLISPPAVEPVSLAEAKLWAKIEFDDDDDLINSLITTAREYAETYTKRQFITATWQMTLDQFPVLGPQWSIIGAPILLPYPKLQSVGTITYTDMAGDVQTLDPSLYLVDTDSMPGRIVRAYAQPWPVIRPIPQSVKIPFTAGYGDSPDDVPAKLKTAIKLLVNHWYKNRDAVTSYSSAPLPLAVETLLTAESYGYYS
ncbi:MAG TPA: head-tail connector protein [Pirellulales bacterium]|nr:head-tail connector protein [Pirellulales bacterium]